MPRGPARVLSLLAALVGASIGCVSGGERAAPPSLLLVTVDTLRADHVGSYGYRLDTTPGLDRLVARGVRFADVTVPWPKTWPAMASMLTGKYPAAHGVRLRPRRALPAENETLAEVLRAAGYRTGAVVGNVNLGRHFAFDQGFERFVESWPAELGAEKTRKAPPRPRIGSEKYTDAETVTDQAIDLLGELSRGDAPFFLWVHYIDPHGPYKPPRAYGRLFRGAHQSRLVPLSSLPAYQLQSDHETGLVSLDLGFYKTQYDREIRYVDDQIGRLLDALEESGRAERTLVVLTADHGESLDENGYYLEHGNVPYQTNTAVPLVLALRGRIRPGMVIDRPVGLIDLMPTILEILGRPLPDGVQGTSLVPLLDGEGEGAGPELVFVEAGFFEPTQLAVRRGPWKLTELRSQRDRERFGRDELELYDLSRDPSEQRNVLREHPAVAHELQARLESWRASLPRERGKSDATDLHDLDAGTQRMLEALGYLELEGEPGSGEKPTAAAAER